MGKLCPRGKAAAKRKFDVYPSAYANMYASAVCSGKVTPGGKKKGKRKKKVEDGKFQPCGRKSAKSSKRKYPKCVPLAKAKRMTAGQRKSAVQRKRAVKQGVGGKPTNVKTFAKKKK